MLRLVAVEVDRPEAGAMRRARFRLRINQQIQEVDIVVGTKAQWESSALASIPGWSINIQGRQIIAMRLVGSGESYVPKNLNIGFSRVPQA